AIAVDVGLFLSERRGAQSDADFVALSGAWALLDPGATEADAEAAANAALVANDEQLNASIFGVQVDLVAGCVSVDVRHDSKPLFFAIFGLGSPDIGAHAKACTGAANVPGDLVPIQIVDNPGDCFTTDEIPIFTSMCGIEMAAQNGDPRGILDLEAPGGYCSYSPGAGEITDLLADGATGICLINENEPPSCDPNNNGPWYDCVAIQDGNPKKVLDGIYARLSRDGDCDGDGNGVDDFDETVDLIFDSDPPGDPFTSIYGAHDCSSADGMQKSPRLVTLFVLEDEPGPGNGGYPIIAFAAFYIAGCAHESEVVVSESDLGDRYCGPSYPEPGHAVVYGRFVNLIFTGSGISVPTDQTTAFGIALVE
ncbi:MAG: hypothetical protein V3S94_06590, partial [Gammaproteobacteria bacterium]